MLYLCSELSTCCSMPLIELVLLFCISLISTALSCGVETLHHCKTSSDGREGR